MSNFNFLSLKRLIGVICSLFLIAFPLSSQAKIASIEGCPQKTGTSFDSTNSVAHLGYSNSRHLLNHKGVDYYVAQYTFNGRKSHRFIALHDVRNNEPVIDAEYTSKNVNLREYTPRVKYSNSMIAYYRDFLNPCLAYLTSTETIYSISHYSKHTQPKMSKKYQEQSPSDYYKIAAPIISTEFTTQKSGYDGLFPLMPRYISQGNPSSQLSELHALTVDDVNIARTRTDKKWKEEQRLAKLTPNERAKERLNARDAEDATKFESAYQKGLLSRDRFYWKRFRYGYDLEAIFNGNVNTKDRLFPHLYIGYVNFYSTRCEQTFPSGSKTSSSLPRGRVDAGWYAEMAGNPRTNYKVNQKHWQNYTQYWASIDRKNAMATRRTAKKFLGNIREDFRAMLREENCDSAFLRQFDENIFRLASGKTTLQDDGNTHTYAKGLTARQKIQRPTLFKGCYLRREGDQYGPDPRFCQCLDEQFKLTLSANEYREGAADYKAFDKKLGPPSTQKGDWRYNNILNVCRTCKGNDYDNCIPSLEYTPGAQTYTRLLSDLRSNKWVEKDRLYRIFFMDYVRGYGGSCKNQLGSHEVRRVTFQDYDAYGAVGPSIKNETRIETDYIDAFDRHREYVKFTKPRNHKELNFRDKPEVLRRKLAERPFKQLNQLLSSNAVLRKHFSQGCKSKAVQSVYRRLFNMEH